MKELTTKTESLYGAYVVLSQAKYGKLSDEEKIKVWKIARAMKPMAAKFEEDSKDASEKLKPEDYPNFDEDLQKANEYREKMRQKDLDATTLPMGPAEYKQFMDRFSKYQKTVSDALKEYAEKEVTIKFEPITEETFGKLMASNEWQMNQVVAIGEIIVE